MLPNAGILPLQLLPSGSAAAEMHDKLHVSCCCSCSLSHSRQQTCFAARSASANLQAVLKFCASLLAEVTLNALHYVRCTWKMGCAMETAYSKK